MRNHGLIKDIEDARDWVYKAATTVWLKLQWLKAWSWLRLSTKKALGCAQKHVMEVDLRPGMPPVMDQGQLGSCTDHAWAAALSFVENKEGNGLESFSRLFLYWNARDDKTQDTGSSLRDAIKGVANYGVCTEDLWKYDIAKFTVKPPKAAWDEGLHRQDVTYHSLTTLENLKACLLEGYPFVFGLNIYGPFETLEGPDCTLPMPKSSDEYLGGHALCAVGMSLSRKAFLVRNSWSESFGFGGHFFLPFEYASDPSLFSDAWSPRKMSK